jgi:beta-N-acetylhexosaminidase
MKAIAKNHSAEDAARLAVRAGCDILLVCETPDAQVAAAEGIVRTLEAGEIALDERDDASDRIRRLKERFLLPYADPTPRGARAAAGAPERRALAEEIARVGGAHG